MLNGHKMSCPRCEASLVELQISYLDYTNMSKEERAAFTARLRDPERLAKLSTTYRMYKYSKWYKELQDQTSCHIYPFDNKRTLLGLAATN
ncbi:MAG: hypothetical protein K2P64_00260 [Lachnospiraceae bacterium]|nr:hypothetical protein [Lachnospiraceae bacterium]